MKDQAYEKAVEEAIIEIFESETLYHDPAYTKRLVFDVIEMDYKNDKSWAQILELLDIKGTEQRKHYLQGWLRSSPNNVIARIALARLESAA